MEETEKQLEDLRRETHPIDRRFISLMIVAFVLGLITFYAISNYDTILVGQVKGDEWEKIDTRVVEQNCLDQARKIAIAEGYNELAVLSCSCINVQTSILKTFDCNVNTVDITKPARKVLVHCYKTSNECTIASDKGLETYNFQELEEKILR